MILSVRKNAMNNTEIIMHEEQRVPDSVSSAFKKEKGTTEKEEKLPIGVFDSGLGGISVLRDCVALLPNENYIYYGDSANAPYGVRTTEEIYDLTIKAIDKMAAQRVKAIVVACNTATSAAIKTLRKKYDAIPVIGVEPALKPAVLHKTGGTVVVMATPATLREEKFRLLMESYKNQAKIIKFPCPGLVEYVECGELYSEKLRTFLQLRFKELKGERIDSVVLGCTHYPFIKKILQEVVGPEVAIFDGGAGTARQLKRKLQKNNLLKTDGKKGCIVWENSSVDKKMKTLSKKLFMS